MTGPGRFLSGSRVLPRRSSRRVGPGGRDRYMPLTVTFVPAPSTRMTAAFGATLSEPSPPFLIAPAIVTLLARAPLVRLTGRPPIVVQGQRLLATDTRLPPVPPNPISAPLTFRSEPPLKLTSGPFISDRVLPLTRLKRSPVTRRTLPPARLSAAPAVTVRALRSRFTSEPRLVTAA